MDARLADRLARGQRAALERQEEEDRRDAFATALGVRRMKWSGYNLSRLLNLTDKTSVAVAEMRGILGALGMGHPGGMRYYDCIGVGGVFDHGEMWGRDRVPLLLVGHPYDITAEESDLLEELRRFECLSVGVDDRPSYYGHGTHHVRIGLAEALWPKVPTRADRAMIEEATR